MRTNDILRSICVFALGAAVLVANIALFHWLFGTTATVVYGIVQAAFAAWMAYEIVHAPTLDD